MEKHSGKGKEKEEMDFQGNGLRDNPKKSWRSLGLADDHSATASSMLKFQCKVCGKEFESMKALFGHMRHHSGREKKGANCQGCGRKFQSLKALTGHNMRLHPVKQLGVDGESGPAGLRQGLVLESITVKRKRSKRMRYNNDPNSSLSRLNESSSGVVEFDKEMEDAALCLIMLSKGVRNWIELNNYFWKSFDNKSEIKDLHPNQEIMQNQNGESFEVKKPTVAKSDSAVSASMNVFYANNLSECKELDSGIMINKVKKVGSEAPNDMLYGGVEFRRMYKVDDDDESGFELYDTEIEERISGQDLLEGSDLAGLGSTKSSSCKDNAMLDACDAAEPGGDSLNKLISTPLNSEISDHSRKKNKYKCRICSKTFKSHQALGGHQTIHRKSNSCALEHIEDSEKITQSCSSPEIEASRKLVKVEYVGNSVEEEMNGVTIYGTKGYKVHECRICFKVFASRQALGGHRRSHILKNLENSDKQPAKQLEFFDINDLIDLNLPVMHNEEANGDIGFKLCWIGSDCKSKTLVSLVAN